MLSIDRRVIEYRSPESGRNCRHHLLIAHVGGKNILLSHPNLFLYDHTLSSIETSNRYSGVISMFYRFLSTEPKFSGVDVGKYHVISDNRDIKKWQVTRQVTRMAEQKASPSSDTIFEDAKIVLTFFHWLSNAGYITNVVVKTKTWVANFKNSRMLNYIRRKARVRIDAKNIEVLDKERRQRKQITLITNDEIKALLESFTDPVYAAMFKLSLGTAMRPMDLCRVPYIGNGSNKHIMPYSTMSKSASATVDYLVKESKGKKDRTIKINRADLKALEDHYIRPLYSERTKKYEERFGKKCPPSILFLNSRGVPVTPSRISSRTNDAKKIAAAVHPDFRETTTFYEARHWWPTMFLVNFFKDKLLTDAADALYLAAAQVLADQMGHEDINTTYKHYVDLARLMVMAHQGHVHELITEPDETVTEFLERIGGEIV
jgi:integrase